MPSSSAFAAPLSSGSKFSLNIVEWRQPAGYCYKYDISESRIRITMDNDFGIKDKFILENSLNESASLKLFSALSAVPWGKLKESYNAEGVSDGQYLTVVVKTDSVAKEISMHSACPEELEDLIAVVNENVPEKYRTVCHDTYRRIQKLSKEGKLPLGK